MQKVRNILEDVEETLSNQSKPDIANQLLRLTLSLRKRQHTQTTSPLLNVRFLIILKILAKQSILSL